VKLSVQSFPYFCRNKLDRQAKTLTDGYTKDQKEAIVDMFKLDSHDSPTDYVKLLVG
jgi:hypothetical protein